jgi:hypothetical protein
MKALLITPEIAPRVRAAATDFSWDGAGPRYTALFRHLVSDHAA